MIKEAINILVSGQSLNTEQAAQVMEEIMSGEATPAQFGAFVTALTLKGETIDEIVGLATVMRAKAIPVSVSGPVIDTCGTGGDNSYSFNISTAAALIAAGAGLKVAKHGNRAMTSGCGSADVLEALGVKIDMNAEQVAECLEKVGIGFMFAPLFHPAMKYASGPRREIGIRTVFNILGPLTNPAGAKAQVIGVPSKELGEKIASVLCRLGTKHALVVHGLNGMDEISISSRSIIWDVKEDEVLPPYYIAPEDFGFKRASIKAITGGTPQENAEMMWRILKGEPGAHRNIVLVNAAAALVAGDKAKTFKEGISLAEEVVDSGSALEKLEGLINISQRFK